MLARVGRKRAETYADGETIRLAFFWTSYVTPTVPTTALKAEKIPILFFISSLKKLSRNVDSGGAKSRCDELGGNSGVRSWCDGLDADSAVTP